MHPLNGVTGPTCSTKLCAAGAQQVYMPRTGGAGGPLGTVLVSEQDVSSASSCAGFAQGAAVLSGWVFWGWFPLSPGPLYGDCIVCPCIFAK